MKEKRKLEVQFAHPWSSLLEGDEQLDWPNSQTTMECSMHVLHKFWGVNINTTAFCLGQYSLHLPLLKSSIAHQFLRAYDPGVVQIKELKYPEKLFRHRAEGANLDDEQVDLKVKYDSNNESTNCDL